MHSSQKENVLGKGLHPNQRSIGNVIIYSLVHGFEPFGRLIDGVSEGVIVVSDRLRQLISIVCIWRLTTHIFQVDEGINGSDGCLCESSIETSLDFLEQEFHTLARQCQFRFQALQLGVHRKWLRAE